VSLLVVAGVMLKVVGATLPAALALLLAVGVAWLAARRGDPR
jgi:phosphotransferase system  glucose/maltose/N-acetylglucosamine-specific IIC component